MKTWLRQITDFPALHKKCSGISWQALTETIANQHRTRARELLATLKNATQNKEAIPPAIKKVHELTHAILYTYHQYPTAANITSAEARNLTVSRCSSVYTEHISLNSLNDFELIIKQSINIVMKELCAWEWDLFAWSESHTTNLMNPSRALNDRMWTNRDLVQEFSEYTNKSQKLMDWLGWDDWHECDRKCNYNELCYISMWPVIYAPGKHQGGFYADEPYTAQEMYEFWRLRTIASLGRSSSQERGNGENLFVLTKPWKMLVITLGILDIIKGQSALSEPGGVIRPLKEDVALTSTNSCSAALVTGGGIRWQVFASFKADDSIFDTNTRQSNGGPSGVMFGDQRPVSLYTYQANAKSNESVQ
ncbi:hypothetical protein BDV96DRAFT_666675 [Lophiotrema nucula]|uniref:Uncharacterized protein n=1 Tax=Lophiotrema nucula TaxID=690887 RepID=A0A6A5YWA0_9PLEO|nr:hypothetical protein BDV96DRAFT_666675 [Lophiotrema nucula]